MAHIGDLRVGSAAVGARLYRPSTGDRAARGVPSRRDVDDRRSGVARPGACRRLALGAGTAVPSVDFRRAPEHPWPAAVDDCVDAIRWAAPGGFPGPRPWARSSSWVTVPAATSPRSPVRACVLRAGPRPVPARRPGGQPAARRRSPRAAARRCRHRRARSASGRGPRLHRSAGLCGRSRQTPPRGRDGPRISHPRHPFAGRGGSGRAGLHRRHRHARPSRPLTPRRAVAAYPRSEPAAVVSRVSSRVSGFV